MMNKSESTTNPMAHDVYHRAWDELQATLRSRKATLDQKEQAIAAMRKLNRAGRDHAAARVTDRTQQVRQLADVLEQVVRAMQSSGGPFRALGRLQRIADDARAVLEDRPGERTPSEDAYPGAGSEP